MGSQATGPHVMSAGGKAVSFDHVLQKLQVSSQAINTYLTVPGRVGQEQRHGNRAAGAIVIYDRDPRYSSRWHGEYQYPTAKVDRARADL